MHVSLHFQHLSKKDQLVSLDNGMVYTMLAREMGSYVLFACASWYRHARHESGHCFVSHCHFSEPLIRVPSSTHLEASSKISTGHEAASPALLKERCGRTPFTTLTMFSGSFRGKMEVDTDSTQPSARVEHRL